MLRKRLLRPIAAVALGMAIAGGVSGAVGDVQAAAVPRPAHLVVVIMENYGFNEIIGNPNAPYINSLASSSALLTNYHAVSHPSEPNYLDIYSGSTQGTDGSDACTTSSAPSLGGEARAAGISIAGYFEGMGTSPATDTGSYVCRHNPMAQFSDSAGLSHPFTDFPSGNYAALPQISFVVPDLANDMHNGSIASGDAWLRTNIDPYLQWARQNDSMLVVVWDENDSDPNYNANQPGENGNNVAAIVAGANVTPGTYGEYYDHNSLLRTIEDAFGLAPLGASASASPFAVFSSGAPAPSPATSSTPPNPATSTAASAGTVLYDFEDGTTQGWSVDYGPATVANTTDMAFSGSHSLAITLTGAGNPGIMSPPQPPGIGVGTAVTYHVYEPPGLDLAVTPYAMDEAWSAHFAPAATLTPGGWSTVTWTVPALSGGLRYIGLEVENGGGERGTLALDAVSASDPVPAGATSSASQLAAHDAQTSPPPSLGSTSQTTAPPADSPTTSSAPMFDFEDGTTQGWFADWGPATVANTTAVAFSGMHSLAIHLLGAGNPGISSPGNLTGVTAGTELTYHIYEPSALDLEVDPYAMDGTWKAHFTGVVHLDPGQWTTVTWTVPALSGGLRYVGLEVENGGGQLGTLALDAVDRAGAASSLSTQPATTSTPAGGSSSPPSAPTSPTTAAAGAASASSSETPMPDGPGGTWRLVFDDEFNGSSLDTSKWAPDWFGNGGSMNNVGTYSSNVSVANGVLSLKLASPSSGALVSTNPNGGASPGFQFTYGYAEARIWFPGSGSTIDNWPAFWTDGQNWPADGEIDIAEGLGTLTSNYHNSSGAFNSNTIPGTWSAGWHTYGVDWEPGSITVYWDGKVVRTLTSATTSITSSPQYLVLNMGAGQGPTVTGASMLVDYVRVWQH
ncbi:MAG TPA: alkaline phosphatase family protein [Acidimicrobiales bacterium]|nr:alkaline phosphatase family protein [Acidimicrobiales bacterium]